MPRQDTKRALPVTPSNFEAPFETVITRYGIKGLNLTDAIDAVEPDEMTRMVNLIHQKDGAVTPRNGLTGLAIAGTTVHSVRRLNDPLDSTFTRIWGIDTGLYYGSSGALTLKDSGYSGNPLTLVSYRPPFSGQTWMFVGDSARMQKIRTDGLTLPIGLPAPTNAASAALDTEQRTTIANFLDDGTQAANWVPNAGYTFPTDGSAPVATGVPQQPIPVSSPQGGGGTDGVSLTTDEAFNAVAVDGIVPFGYFTYYGCPKTLDLSKTGVKDATDEDYIHLWLNFSHVDKILEFRLYLVCSETFSPSIIPGVSNVDGANGDAYVKAFSSNDFSSFVQVSATQTDAAEISRVRNIRDTDLEGRAVTKPFDSGYSDFDRNEITARDNTAVASTDPSRTITVQSGSGSDQWNELGILSIPIRRGDFQRIGVTPDRDWSNITGLIALIKVADHAAAVTVRVAELYMTGGSGPDSGEPSSLPYDYRYTHYDTRTGAEGNPSPTMDATDFVDTLRRAINVTPTAYGFSGTVQKFYRRGGTLPTDWYFVGQNTSDGGVFTDDVSDNTAVAANTVAIDNDRPVTTEDASGNTILNQPLVSIWGPMEDILFGCGDPYRPGFVYFSKPEHPEAWPATNTVEVCSPSEQLMAGCLYGGQAYVFSRERLFILYPNLTGETTSVTSTVTQCKHGLINPWALAVGLGGIYFVAPDGVYRTAGGPEEWISRKIDPLFNGVTKNGVAPIDFNQPNKIRLAIFDNELWMSYVDTNGAYQTMIFAIHYNFWRQYTFTGDVNCFMVDEGNTDDTLLAGGSGGHGYTHTGTSDGGAEIACSIRTGAIDIGKQRIEKLLGDQALSIDTQGVVVTLQNFLNWETVTNPTNTLTADPGRIRAIFDNFGQNPQRAMNISTEVSWSTGTEKPILYWLGIAGILEPEVTMNRVTQWDDLGHSDDSYVTGCTFDADTGGGDITVNVEYDFNGLTQIAAVLTVNTNGRHKQKFSWPAVRANKVRIRPASTCGPWILYRLDWDWQPEPPIIARWDIHFENAWDQYYTGLDLYCDTFGLDKTVEVYVDSVLVKTETVNTTSRLVHHITLPWGRGHVFHFIATDNNPGQLYEYRWHVQEEPSEQANWNQNFSVEGTEADKWLKAIVFQCDTFGVDKTVTVECDGTVVETLTINTNGRKVVQKAFPQHLGRVFRVYPTDSNNSRLYSLWWVFDQEPLALDRWETQEIDHGVGGWHYPVWANVTLKSTSDVTLTLTAYNQSGAATTNTYTIPSTGGLKQKVFLPFQAVKGVLWKYIFTSTDPFWLYREETIVHIRVWGTDTSRDHKPFGNDDLDTTRVMTKASSSASRSGGGTA